VPDHYAGLFGFDDDLAGVFVEIEVGDAGVVGDDLTDP
jgi:hypothetical protein